MCWNFRPTRTFEDASTDVDVQTLKRRVRSARAAVVGMMMDGAPFQEVRLRAAQAVVAQRALDDKSRKMANVEEEAEFLFEDEERESTPQSFSLSSSDFRSSE